MTTENIEGLEGIEELIGKVGTKVAGRRGALRKERDGRRRHEANMALGAAAAIQRSRDRRVLLDEEEEQLDEMQRMASALLEAAERAESEESSRSEAPAREEPTPPPAAVAEGESAGEHTRIIPVTEPVRNVHALDVRHWDGRQWLWAAIGLAIGLVVSVFTWHPLVAAGHVYGSGRAVFVTFWFICLCGIGFFGGGHLGYQTEDGSGDREED